MGCESCNKEVSLVMEPIKAGEAWIVKWENGKTKRYTPYDSMGMTRFIERGFENGRVFINDEEIVITEKTEFGIYYKVKDD